MAVQETSADRLHTYMQANGIPSLRALARHSGVSRRQIEWLRQGQVQHLSIHHGLQLAAVLKLSLTDLLHQFGDDVSVPLEGSAPTVTAQSSTPSVPSTDFQHQQTDPEDLRSHFLSIFQADALNILESLILQWPTAAQAAQQTPTLPAIRLIPLLKPLEQLLQSWEIVAIATVGEMVLYDPTQHQWIGETAPPEVNHSVQVSHIGYRQRERLLYRAKVRLPKSDAILS